MTNPHTLPMSLTHHTRSHRHIPHCTIKATFVTTFSRVPRTFRTGSGEVDVLCAYTPTYHTHTNKHHTYRRSYNTTHRHTHVTHVTYRHRHTSHTCRTSHMYTRRTRHIDTPHTYHTDVHTTHTNAHIRHTHTTHKHTYTHVTHTHTRHTHHTCTHVDHGTHITHTCHTHVHTSTHVTHTHITHAHTSYTPGESWGQVTLVAETPGAGGTRPVGPRGPGHELPQARVLRAQCEPRTSTSSDRPGPLRGSSRKVSRTKPLL